MNEKEKQLIKEFISHLANTETDELFDYLKKTSIDSMLIQLKAERKARLTIEKNNLTREIGEL